MSVSRIERSFGEHTRPVLTRLAKPLDCTAHQATLSKDRIVYVESRRSDQYRSEYLQPGRTDFVHCSALGKVLAAYLPAEHLQALVKRIPFDARRTPSQARKRFSSALNTYATMATRWMTRRGSSASAVSLSRSTTTEATASRL